jgi:hypothetical protein
MNNVERCSLIYTQTNSEHTQAPLNTTAFTVMLHALQDGRQDTSLLSNVMNTDDLSVEHKTYPVMHCIKAMNITTKNN